MRISSLVLVFIVFMPGLAAGEIIVKSSSSPQLCAAARSVLSLSEDWVAHDPEKQQGEPFLNFPHGAKISRAPWFSSPMVWNNVKAANEEKYVSLIGSGEQYGISMNVYRVTVNIFRQTRRVDLYSVHPKSRMSKLKQAQMFAGKDDPKLAEVVGSLNALTIWMYNNRGYFVVRSPGQVSLHEIDATGEDRDNPSYTSKMVCDFSLDTKTSEAQLPPQSISISAPPSPPVAPETPAADSSGSATTNPCLSHKENPHYYVVCLDRHEKIERLKEKRQ